MKIVNLSSVFGSCGSQRQSMMTARKVGGRMVGRRRCRFIWMGWVLWLTGFVVGLPHGKVGKGVGSHIFKICIVKEENSGWLRLTDITK